MSTRVPIFEAPSHPRGTSGGGFLFLLGVLLSDHAGRHRVQDPLTVHRVALGAVPVLHGAGEQLGSCADCSHLLPFRKEKKSGLKIIKIQCPLTIVNGHSENKKTWFHMWL